MKLTRKQLKKIILEELNLNEGKKGWSYWMFAQMDNYDLTKVFPDYIRDAFFENVSSSDNNKLYNKRLFNDVNEFIYAINDLRGQPGYNNRSLNNKAIMHIRTSLSGVDDEVLVRPSRRYQDEPDWQNKVKHSELDLSDTDIFE